VLSTVAGRGSVENTSGEAVRRRREREQSVDDGACNHDAVLLVNGRDPEIADHLLRALPSLMPLISQQHVLVSDGINSDVAMENFFKQVDELPAVKIVSMSALMRDTQIMGAKVQAIKIVAVVQEVDA